MCSDIILLVSSPKVWAYNPTLCHMALHPQNKKEKSKKRNIKSRNIDKRKR